MSALKTLALWQLTKPGNTSDTEVRNEQLLSKPFKDYLFSYKLADVIFIVGQERIPAHRFLLATQSEHFRTLLLGDMAESKQTEICLPAPYQLFKDMLTFMYVGELSLSQSAIKGGTVLDLLDLASEYAVSELVKGLEKFLGNNLNVDNVCDIARHANELRLDTLTANCFNYIEQQPATFFHTSALLNQLGCDTLARLLGRDTLFLPEEVIFVQILAWSERNQEADMQPLLAQIRFPLINIDCLLRCVEPAGLLDSDQLLKVLKKKHFDEVVPLRHVPPKLKRRLHSRSGANTFYLQAAGPDRTCGDMISLDMGKHITIDCFRFCLCVSAYTPGCSYELFAASKSGGWLSVFKAAERSCHSWQMVFTARRLKARYVKILHTCKEFDHSFRIYDFEAGTFCGESANAALPQMGASLISGFNCVRPSQSGYAIENLMLVTNGKSTEVVHLMKWGEDESDEEIEAEAIRGEEDCGEEIEANCGEEEYDEDFADNCEAMNYIKPGVDGYITLRLGRISLVKTIKLQFCGSSKTTYNLSIEGKGNFDDPWSEIRKLNNVEGWQNIECNENIGYIRMMATTWSFLLSSICQSKNNQIC